MIYDTENEIPQGMLECINMPHSASTFNEGLDLILSGNVEFVEFPLDSMGPSGRELIDLSAGISSASGWLEDSKLENLRMEPFASNSKNSLYEPILKFIKNIFYNQNSELFSPIAYKLSEIIDDLNQQSSHIMDYDILNLRSTPYTIFNSLDWHADNAPSIGKELESSIAVLIPLKGPGTKFCELSDTEREIFNQQQYLLDKPEMSDLLSKICFGNNIFQSKPYHGVIFNTNANFSAIHSAPDFWGERFSARITYDIKPQD